MNTTMTHMTAHASSATAEARKASPTMRRMAREASALATEGTTGAPDQSQRGEPSVSATTKIAAVIALLGRKHGATLAEMIGVTGWLPHTTRAALTGLKKKGYALSKDKRDDVTCYRIVSAG